jgi:hypothetical protein
MALATFWGDFFTNSSGHPGSPTLVKPFLGKMALEQKAVLTSVARLKLVQYTKT